LPAQFMRVIYPFAATLSCDKSSGSPVASRVAT
jgi:hypothetical protein